MIQTVAPPQKVLRDAQLTGYLEELCQQIELSPTQFKLAEERYQAVGSWLQESDNVLLRTADIYPQGSFSLETTVKPEGQAEYDLDLVYFLALGRSDLSPAQLKEFVGDRLKAARRYESILEEKPRCWRLNYANEFHLDVTPAIPNPNCPSNGELVPDKKLQCWKPTNPRGYRAWFEDKASISPTFILVSLDARQLAEVKADIEALPGPTKFKGILRRCVQLCKRHRDIRFKGPNASLAPISIVLTTLAARSYEHCALHKSYETELELLVDVVRTMPQFVERIETERGTQYAVWNESTEGENFAEKWNQKPELARAFFDWNQAALDELGSLSRQEGIHNVMRSLSESFGDGPVDRAFAAVNERISSARSSVDLGVAPSVGIVTSSSRGTQVTRNTFFGTEDR